MGRPSRSERGRPLSLGIGGVEAQKLRLPRKPDCRGCGEDRRCEERRFRWKGNAAHRRQYARSALAGVLGGDASRRLGACRPLAVANLEEGPAFARGFCSDFSPRKRTDEKLQNKRVGREPACWPPPPSEETFPRLIQFQPLGATLAVTHRPAPCDPVSAIGLREVSPQPTFISPESVPPQEKRFARLKGSLKSVRVLDSIAVLVYGSRAKATGTPQ
jgi:hypothetical protein